MQAENTQEEKVIDLYGGHMWRHDELNDKLNSKDENYDSVHRPKHYQSKDGSIEVIQIIEQFELNYRLGNVCKYILRANNKHETPREDAFKALWYLCREIKAQGHSSELRQFFEKQLKEIK